MTTVYASKGNAIHQTSMCVLNVSVHYSRIAASVNTHFTQDLYSIYCIYLLSTDSQIITTHMYLYQRISLCCKVWI